MMVTMLTHVDVPCRKGLICQRAETIIPMLEHNLILFERSQLTVHRSNYVIIYNTCEMYQM